MKSTKGKKKGLEEMKGLKRAVKVALKPTPEQKVLLKQWTSATRRVYNSCVEGTRLGLKATLDHLRPYALSDPKRQWTMEDEQWVFTYRRKIRLKKGEEPDPDLFSEPDRCWTLEEDRWTCTFIKKLVLAKGKVPPSHQEGPDLDKQVPYNVKDSAVREFCSAVTASIRRHADKNNKRFVMSFRSRKDARQGFVVQKKYWHDRSRKGDAAEGMRLLHSPGAWAAATRRRGHRRPEDAVIPAVLPSDGRVVVERNGKHVFLIYTVTETSDQRGVPTERAGAACAIDPGVRTFATIYSPQREEVTEWGSGGMTAIFDLCYKADRLQERLVKAKRRERWRLRLQFRGVHDKIRNKVADIHWKCANYLVDHFDEILLPEFQSARMARKSPERKLRSKTARAMLTWSHYRFRQRLQWVAARKRGHGCRVVLCTEEYTSKTCNKCGELHDRLGSSKVFRCPACGLTTDRDWNGARGIYLKCEGLLV